MLKNISIDELEIGMYVKDIILKNSDHKVKNQGIVNSNRTIELLKKQGVARVVIELSPEECHNQAVEEQEAELAEEFSRACDIYDQATENVKNLLLHSHMGKPLSPESMNILAGEITESLLRNEHAITILTRIRQKSNYQWEHSINCAVLICGFALFLGQEKDKVQEMTLGALLHDVGSAKVPKAILEKNDNLTVNERSVVEKHVFWGIELVKREGFTSPIIIDMLVNHHERIDGSGYPRGIKGEKLSKLARMMAIVDVYDAMTGDRPHKKGKLPQAILRHLLKNKQIFDEDLVQQFIKYLSIHPVGSLVKLSNDKLAIVIECNRHEPLKPRVKVIYSLKLNSYIKPVDHDLTEEEFAIVSTEKASDYQINLNKLIREMFSN